MTVVTKPKKIMLKPKQIVKNTSGIYVIIAGEKVKLVRLDSKKRQQLRKKVKKLKAFRALMGTPSKPSDRKMSRMISR